MTTDEQLNLWVNGKNVHNDERDECCPNFSCCQNHYKASTKERIIFRDHPELRMSILITFLTKSLSSQNIYVVEEQEGILQ